MITSQGSERFFCWIKHVFNDVALSFFLNSTSHNHSRTQTEAGNGAFHPTKHRYAILWSIFSLLLHSHLTLINLLIIIRSIQQTLLQLRNEVATLRSKLMESEQQKADTGSDVELLCQMINTREKALGELVLPTVQCAYGFKSLSP